MVKSINQCPIGYENNGFKTVFIDKTGSKKMDDGYDPSRDLVQYSAKYDENKNILIKVKVDKYDRRAFDGDSLIVFLIDFLKDNGSYLLPFSIRGATDHWWEVAYSIKNEKINEEVADDVQNIQNKQILTLQNIDEKESEITVKIDTKKLKELGWDEDYPLYIQILTVKNDTITDSFNDPKPYENANFLVGAMPINKFLKYNSKCFEIAP